MKNKICKWCWIEYSPVQLLQNCCSYPHKVKYDEKRQKEKKAVKREAKKISVSILWLKADKLWSEYIRKIWKCEYCWKTEFLNAHHIIWRNAKSVRREISNWISLCSGCHTFSSSFSAHKNPYLFSKWLEDYKGVDYMNKLIELSNIPLKVTSEYLQDKISNLKQLLED